MMKHFTYWLLMAALAAACSSTENQNHTMQSPISETTINNTIQELVENQPDEQSARIEKGVRQVAALWRNTDGDQTVFESFVPDHFIGDPAERELVFHKISRNLEILLGHQNKMVLDLQAPLHLEGDPMHPIDQAFGAYSPGAHMTEDFFRNKIAFRIILNFPHYSLAEKSALGPAWSRQDWAYARLGDIFTSRVPPELNQQYSQVSTASDIYISEYNIYVGRLLNEDNEPLFGQDMKLLLHWNLRDEIKASYATGALEKQRLIYEAMKRIVRQEIPQAVINSQTYTWNPYTNQTYKHGAPVKLSPEPDERYQQILNNFQALRAMDPYEPELNTFIRRSFDGEKELSREEVEQLFIAYASAPVLKEVAGLIRQDLGRDLEAFDIWYDGFKPRSGIDGDELDAITRTKYPDPEAFEKDLPVILTKLGFSGERAAEITSRVTVDAARGSGHAWGAAMRSEKAHLRTRIGEDGMDYKGYNIAIHEFGHNVEQTISLHDVDYYVMNGVPNTAFTEALAFVFQKQDLMLLGMEQPDPLYRSKEVLDDVWSTFEIMGVSLVDMRLWKWLYAHPDATPEQTREATLRIAREVWNEYFAPVFGVQDEPILAVYSHMISYPLYLSNYAIGSLIQFQIEQHLEGKDFAAEVERMFSMGRLTPQEWMRRAVGSEISAEPMLSAAKEAVKAMP